jgi:hypothetical protein
MTLKKITIACAVLLGCLSSAARTDAATITWTLNNFTFADGGVASGFFDWNTVTQSSPNYAVSVSGGNTTTYPPLIYTDESTDFVAGSNTVFFFDPTEPLNYRVFRIGLVNLASLDTPQPFLTLTGNNLTGSSGFVECYNCLSARFGAANAGAYLSATPVPEPATLWLVAMGAGAGRLLRRRKSS